MHAYDDSDHSTPQSLLEESVTFARMILDDLKQANIAPHKKFGNVQEISIKCLPPDADAYIRKMYQEDGGLIVNRASYEASHPAVIDSFRSVIDKLMKDSGFVKTEHDKRYEAYQEDDFSCGGTFSTASIIGFSIACDTEPEKFRAALMPDEDKLRRFCLEGLKENFAETAAFRARMKAAGMDKVRTGDPVAYVEELKRHGLRGPRVITPRPKGLKH